MYNWLCHHEQRTPLIPWLRLGLRLLYRRASLLLQERWFVFESVSGYTRIVAIVAVPLQGQMRGLPQDLLRHENLVFQVPHLHPTDPTDPTVHWGFNI